MRSAFSSALIGVRTCHWCHKTEPAVIFGRSRSHAQGRQVWCCLTCRPLRLKQTRKRLRLLHLPEERQRVRDRNRNLHAIDPRPQMVRAARRRAKLLGLPFSLTVSDLTLPAICPILAQPFVQLPRKQNAFSPSLDRIIPELGYVCGNVRVISKLANAMKNGATPEQLLAFARNIPAYLGV